MCYDARMSTERYLYAENEIRKSYGERVTVAGKSKSLRKFGRNDVVGTSLTTLWLSPPLNESYVSTNLITTMVSDNSNDLIAMKIEGHTVDADGNFTFVVQIAFLLGLTPVTLTTPLARVSRVYNFGATNLVGDVFITEDDTFTAGVPDTDSKVHCEIRAGFDQSFKCATTTSQYDYFIIEEVHASILKKQSATVNLFLEVRLKGGIFLPKYEWAVTSSGTSSNDQHFAPQLIVPPNADVRVRGISTNAGTEVAAGFAGVFAIKM